MTPESTPELTIVIPIHNGASHLAATLRALETQMDGRMRLVLVLNGCVDASAEVARTWLDRLAGTGADVRLLQAARASRAAALNLGDDHAAGHRLYVDQDAVLSPDAIRDMLAGLDRGFHFVGAQARWRTPSRLVGAAMAAWNAAPYVRDEVVTAGAYALSERGRARWTDWPEGLPDDKYARLHFDLQDRLRIEGAYEVEAPDSLQGLVQARRRYRRSNASLRRLTPHLARRDGPRLRTLWRTPLRRWSGLTVLAAVEILAAASSRP